MRKPRGYWSLDRCIKESLKYDNRTDFNKNNKSAYMSSYKNGWLDEVCSHMKPKGNIYKRCIYSYEFSDKSVYVGLTYNIEKRQNNRNYDINDKVTKYISETKLFPRRLQLTEYVDVEEAVKLEDFYVKKYIKDGWTVLNSSKTGSIGGNIIKWTKEECQKVSILFNSRFEFKNKLSGAYFASLKNNWLDDICQHMNHKKQKPKNFWNLNNCIKYFKKCKNLKDFKNKYGGGYNSVLKYKWLDKLK